VGDSLTGMSSEQSLARLRAAGWAPITLNAQSGRRIPEAGTRKNPDGTVTKVISGIAAVQHIRATEPDAPTWIVGLGTNDIGATGPDPVAVRKVIEQMLDEIGPGHRIAWVNIHHGTDPEGTAVFNSVLAAVAAERTDLVVADWAALATTPGYLIDDHIHLTEAGKVAFADLVTATAERLARRPLDGHLVIRVPRAT
jgi:lysophospholipase L1-like esterase